MTVVVGLNQAGSTENRVEALGLLKEACCRVVESVRDRISDVADAAVERIQDGAAYVRQTNLRSMGVNLKDFVKRYPTASVVFGALVGFLVVWSLSDTSETT